MLHSFIWNIKLAGSFTNSYTSFHYVRPDILVTLFLSAVTITNRNHKSLFCVCCTLSMERTPHWSPRVSSDTVSCTFTYHTWQFIIFTIFTITACIFSYSLSISFWTQDLALQQILSSIDLCLSYRTDSTDSRTITLLSGWICLHGVLD